MIAVVEQRKCSGCGECVKICPVEAIRMEKKKAIIGDKCISCGACVSVCPQHAIALN